MANPKYAASDKPVPVSELVDTLSDGTKVKRRAPRMRACNEKDEKGKLCGGHLKRWFYAADVVEQTCGDVREAYGDQGEVYRCEHCRTLYLPSEEEPRGKNVAGVGKLSIFGVTVEPKPAAAKPE